jgi:hypothetical protein
MASLISNNVYPVVIASRILGNGALKGGMPVYKYIFNRVLTLAQNIIMNKKLSEYHSGYRAFSREALSAIQFNNNSNDFVFDNQIIAQLFYKGFNIAEISCPTLYTKESSSINFMRSCKYGIGCMITALQYRLSKWKLIKNKLFE